GCWSVTGVQTCALPILRGAGLAPGPRRGRLPEADPRPRHGAARVRAGRRAKLPLVPGHAFLPDLRAARARGARGRGPEGPPGPEIGRASCRERGESAVG